MVCPIPAFRVWVRTTLANYRPDEIAMGYHWRYAESVYAESYESLSHTASARSFLPAPHTLPLCVHARAMRCLCLVPRLGIGC